MDIPAAFVSATFDDREIIKLLVKLRRGKGDEQQILDELVKITAGRKILLAYRTADNKPEYVCLNSRTINKLRSMFIHTENGEDFTAEYLSDVFIKSIYELEIVRMSAPRTPLVDKQPKTANIAGKMKTVQHPKKKVPSRFQQAKDNL